MKLKNYAESLISRTGEKLKLSDETIKLAFKIVYDSSRGGLTKGRVIEDMALASLYLSSRINREPVTATALALVEPMGNRTRIIKYAKLIMRELMLDVPIASVKDFIRRGVKFLDLPDDVLEAAINLLEVLRRDVSMRYFVAGYAAAILYVVIVGCGLELKVKDIFEGVGVSHRTFRKRLIEVEGFIEGKKDLLGVV